MKIDHIVSEIVQLGRTKQEIDDLAAMREWVGKLSDMTSAVSSGADERGVIPGTD
jgi:hypothetical protein